MRRSLRDLPARACLVAGWILAVGCGGPPAPDGSARPASPGPARASTLATDPAVATEPGAASDPGGAEDCPLPGLRLDLPRRRLVHVAVPDIAGVDAVLFTLGGDLGGGAQLEASTAAPPFSRGGQALDIEGRRFLELRFVGLETRDETGEPVFDGPRDLEPDLPAIRRLIVFDEADGLIAWYLGLAGSGCLTLGIRGDDEVLLLATNEP